mmetsp:Transcript_17252/g.44188  ORF Transcript_17252/g.44188 Transcript_17252/m.44188 type:complete len:234 (-) Transcript_17252:94-795(-)
MSPPTTTAAIPPSPGDGIYDDTVYTVVADERMNEHATSQGMNIDFIDAAVAEGMERLDVIGTIMEYPAEGGGYRYCEVYAELLRVHGLANPVGGALDSETAVMPAEALRDSDAAAARPKTKRRAEKKNVSLKDLLAAGLVVPGEGVLRVDLTIQGVHFDDEGSLSRAGLITDAKDQTKYKSPTDWVAHCIARKKLDAKTKGWEAAWYFGSNPRCAPGVFLATLRAELAEKIAE